MTWIEKIHMTKVKLIKKTEQEISDEKEKNYWMWLYKYPRADKNIENEISMLPQQEIFAAKR